MMTFIVMQPNQHTHTLFVHLFTVWPLFTKPWSSNERLSKASSTVASDVTNECRSSRSWTTPSHRIRSHITPVTKNLTTSQQHFKEHKGACLREYHVLFKVPQNGRCIDQKGARLECRQRLGWVCLGPLGCVVICHLSLVSICGDRFETSATTLDLDRFYQTFGTIFDCFTAFKNCEPSFHDVGTS